VYVSESGYNGYLQCPDNTAFCEYWDYRCPMDCFGNGMCMLDKTCQCFKGYSGCECCVDGTESGTTCGVTFPSFVTDYVQTNNSPSATCTYESFLINLGNAM